MGKSTLKIVAAATAAYFTGGVGGLSAGATAAAAGATVAYSESEKARAQQEELLQQSAEEQRKARSITEAGQAQQAAMEQRQQIREERVRRARILQSAQNTGTAASSGEFGAVGSLATGLSSNIGANLGAIQRGQQISTLNQNAADLNLGAQFAGFEAQNAQSLFSLSTSIFAGQTAKIK